MSAAAVKIHTVASGQEPLGVDKVHVVTSQVQFLVLYFLSIKTIRMESNEKKEKDRYFLLPPI